MLRLLDRLCPTSPCPALHPLPCPAPPAPGAVAEGVVNGMTCTHLVCRYAPPGNYVGNSPTSTYSAQRNVAGRLPACAGYETLMNGTYKSTAFGPVSAPPPPAPTTLG